MPNTRWKDKSDIENLDSTDRIPVTDTSDSNSDKYFTPAEMKSYIIDDNVDLNMIDLTKDENIHQGTDSIIVEIEDQNQVLFGDGVFRPVTSDSIDLGSSDKKFKTLYVDDITSDNIDFDVIDSTKDENIHTGTDQIIVETNGVNRAIFGNTNFRPTAENYDLGTDGSRFGTLYADDLDIDGLELDLLDSTQTKAIYSSGNNILFKVESETSLQISSTYLSSTRDAEVSLGLPITPFSSIYGVSGVFDNLTLDGTSIIASGNQINYLGRTSSDIFGSNETHAQDNTNVTDNLSITNSGKYTADTSGGAFTITLPTITTGKSEEFLIVLETAGNDLTISGNCVTPDGSTAGTGITLNAANDCVYLKSSSISGGKWMILGGNSYTVVGG